MKTTMKNHENLNKNRRYVRKTTKNFFKCLMLTLAITAFTSSCQKDNLEDAVLPQTAQGGQVASGANGENGAQGEQGASGADGQNGENGSDGAQGEQGATGAQGEPGTNGTDGKDGEDGAQGEQGIQGEQGLQGERGLQGEQGVAGVDGEDGNANVIASEWFEPKESSYGCCNPKNKALTLATGIKGKIKDGILLVYYDNDIQVQLLPRYEFSTSGSIVKSVDSHINHASNTLYVSIKKYGSDLNPREYLWDASGPAYGKGVRFRYVIIPSGTSAKNSNIAFKKMSYEEVMDNFGFDY